MDIIQLKEYSVFISGQFAEQDHLARFIEEKKYALVIILADTNTSKYCLPVASSLIGNFPVITIEAGEKNKNIETCKFIWDEFIRHGISRKSMLINLGGGVIGDMGGFAAGTFKRGFDFIQVPTTLLSQVDASVGGKTGIDFNGIKNLVGLFQNPKHVFISTEFLNTLPFDQKRSGFAEVLKHGLIADQLYWEQMRSIDLKDFNNWLPVVKRSVEIKKYVVEQDPYEGGLRKILNFGHTIGHAIETMALLNDEQPLLHGEAIAIGMICEAWLSSRVCGLSQTELNEIITGIGHHFPKMNLHELELNELMQIMQQDKKNKGTGIQFSLLNSIGNCTYDQSVSESMIEEAIQFYNQL